MYSFITFLMGAAPGEGGKASNPILSMLPLVLMFVILYFLMIRPQQKKQKAMRAMVEAMKKGDKVITNGGIHGIIVGLKDATVTIKVADNVKLEFSKSAVISVAKGSEAETN